MRLAGHSFQFPTLSLESACRVTAALDLPALDVGALKGYAHLDPNEIEADPDGTVERIKQAMVSSGLTVSDFFPSFGAGFADSPINDPDSSTQNANRRRFEIFLKIARRVGSPGITLLPGIIQPDLGLKRSLDLSAQTLREYVAMAQDTGLRLSVEGHLGSVVETPELVLDLVSQVPGLTITLDYSHFLAQKIELDRIHRLIPSAGHVHLRQARPGRVQVGAATGTLDFVDIVQRLHSAGYAGYLTIEYTWQDWEGCKNVDNVGETVIIRDLIRPLLSS